MRDLVVGALAHSGLPSLFRSLSGPRAAILTYHGFTDRPGTGLENASGLHLDVAAFDAICRRLARDYRVLPLTEVVAAVRADQTLPKNGVVLTLDDGYASTYWLAFPILRKHQLPATIFVVTDLVHNGRWLCHDRLEHALGHTARERYCGRVHASLPPLDLPLRTLADRIRARSQLQLALTRLPQESLYPALDRIEDDLECRLDDATAPAPIYQGLSWEQIRAMRASGLVAVGSHSHRHRILARCRDAATIDEELGVSKRLLEEQLDEPCTLFAYPNGRPGDHGAQTAERLQCHGFTGAMTSEAGFVTSGAAPLTLPRFGGCEGAGLVELTASGTLSSLLKLKDRIARR